MDGHLIRAEQVRQGQLRLVKLPVYCHAVRTFIDYFYSGSALPT